MNPPSHSTRRRTRRARHPRPRAKRARSAATAAAFLLVCLALPLTPLAGQTTLAADPAPPAPTPDLFSPDATPDQRLAAAAALISAGRIDDLARALSPDQPSTVLIAVAEAISAHSRRAAANGAPGASAPGDPAPDALVRHLAAAVPLCPIDARAALLNALGEYSSRDAVRAVIAFIDESHPPRIRSAAFRTLARQTGRDDLGEDPARWRSWWAEAQWLTEGDWRGRLVRALAARESRLRQQRQSIADRLVDAYRRLYLTTASTDRTPLLVSFLCDELPDVRRLGFELADRELLNARALAPEIAVAALDRLADPNPDLRALAAALVANLDPPGAREILRTTLRNETDPAAAAAMLRAASRRPDIRLAEEAARWLGAPGPPGVAAVTAISAVADAGLLSDPVIRSDALAVPRATAPESLTPADIRLLGLLGDASDRTVLRSLLASDAREVRLAAAEALADWRADLDAVIDVARADSDFYDIAAEGIRTLVPSAEGFRLLESLIAPTPERERIARSRMAAVLPPSELAAVASSIPDPAERLELIAQAATEATDATTRAPLRILVAEARLHLDDPTGALAAIEPVNAAALPMALRQRAGSAKVRSLLLLGRVDDAAAAGGAPDTWLDCLEHCLLRGTPAAPEIAARLTALFPEEQLAPEQRVRLASALDRLAAMDSGPRPQDPAAASVSPHPTGGDES